MQHVDLSVNPVAGAVLECAATGRGVAELTTESTDCINGHSTLNVPDLISEAKQGWAWLVLG